jgi:hypothetical protein
VFFLSFFFFFVKKVLEVFFFFFFFCGNAYILIYYFIVYFLYSFPCLKSVAVGAVSESLISNTNFTGCAVSEAGGALVFLDGSSVNVSFCVFTSCSSGSYGGAISVMGSQV